jgi:hypothetical protein
METGRFRESLTITTDHELVNRIPVHLYGEVLGNINVFPQRLHFVTQTGQPIRERMIVVKAQKSDFTFHVLDVKSSLEDLTHEIIPVAEGREYQIKIGFRDTFDRSFWRGNLVIVTDDKKQERIPVSITLRAQRTRVNPVVNPSKNAQFKKSDSADK